MHMTSDFLFVSVNKNWMTMEWFSGSGSYAQGKDIENNKLPHLWIEPRRIRRRKIPEKLDVDVNLTCILSAIVKANTR